MYVQFQRMLLEAFSQERLVWRLEPIKIQATMRPIVVLFNNSVRKSKFCLNLL